MELEELARRLRTFLFFCLGHGLLCAGCTFSITGWQLWKYKPRKVIESASCYALTVSADEYSDKYCKVQTILRLRSKQGEKTICIHSAFRPRSLV